MVIGRIAVWLYRQSMVPSVEREGFDSLCSLMPTAVVLTSLQLRGGSPTSPPTLIVLQGTLDNNVQKGRCATVIGVKRSEMTCVPYFLIIKSASFSQKGASCHYPGGRGSLQKCMSAGWHSDSCVAMSSQYMLMYNFPSALCPNTCKTSGNLISPQLYIVLTDNHHILVR